jgi:hypothetical protein
MRVLRAAVNPLGDTQAPEVPIGAPRRRLKLVILLRRSARRRMPPIAEYGRLPQDDWSVGWW